MDIIKLKMFLIELIKESNNRFSEEDFLPSDDYKKRLKREFKYIKEYCNNKIINDEAITDSDVWLCDNLYFIEKEYKSIMLQKPKLSKAMLFYTSNTLENLLFNISEKTLYVFSETIFKDIDFCNEDIIYLQTALKINIISFIYASCSSHHKYISELITSLRFICEFDFFQIINGYSPIEKLLRQDPSGEYPNMDKSTKRLYSSRIISEAKKQKISPVLFTQNILNNARRDNKHIGFYLFQDNKRHSLYFSLVIVFSVLFYSLFFICTSFESFGIFKYIIPFLLLFPFFDLSKQIVDFIFSKLFRPHPIFKMKVSSISEENRTLTVITSLLSTSKDAESLKDKLELSFLSQQDRNEEKNLFFGLLVDLKESDKEVASDDEEIISSVKKVINDLNGKYGGFCLLIRNRRYNDKEKKYMGYERKRGAILQLAELLNKKEKSDFIIYGDKRALENIKYVITLDSDTEFSFDQINSLVGAMTHPLNRPVIGAVKGRNVIISGHAIMQPVILNSLESAGKTPFCALFSGAAGVESYSFATFDINKIVFNKGIFCGKGIFDVSAFYAVLNDVFPENSVLSHDILEGALLNAASVNNEYFFDSLPSTPISYYKRAHRWARGDIQSLRFAFSHFKSFSEKVIKNPISAEYKYILFLNAFKVILPIVSYLLLFVSLFLPGSISSLLSSFAVLYIFSPFVINICSVLFLGKFQLLYRNCFSNILSGIYNTFLIAIYNLAALSYVAFLNFDATIRSVYRMVFSKKNLLQWVTASQTERKNELKDYIFSMWFSLFSSILFFLFSSTGFLRVISLLWFVFPFVSYFLGKPFKKKNNINKKDKEILIKYASDTWNYFSNEVTKEYNFLPPDNVSFNKGKVVAERTSPTNIGLYLICVMTARDIGRINTNQMVEIILNTISTIKKMEKYYGHLYNWYDIKTLEVLPTPYISTVDSGNFIVSLLTLSQGLVVYAAEDRRIKGIINDINKLIFETDFSILYNVKKELFHIGFNVNTLQPDDCYYDLYMSEARTTSYYAIANRLVDKRHWKKLNRALVEKGGYLGAMSWTATAFEYFMPTLFLPVYENSFERESLLFAFKQQKHFSVKISKREKVFGVGESAYSEVDNNNNYQYKAFGIPTLRLKREKENDKVISPYSSFLMLSINIKDVISNLMTLEKIGMYDKYGFYDSIDFTHFDEDGGKIVKTYMAHHQGMIMLAVSNAVFDNINCKRFMNNTGMWAARQFIKEKIPVDAIVYKNSEDKAYFEKNKREMFTFGKEIDKNTEEYLISKNSLALFFTCKGLNRLIYKVDKTPVFVNKYATNRFDYSGSFVFYIKVKDKIYSTSSDVLECSFDKNEIVYKLPKKISVKISFCGVNGLSFEIRTKGGHDVKVGILFFPICCETKGYLSHPAFKDLFLNSVLDKKRNCLVIEKKRQNEREITAALAIGCDGDFKFECGNNLLEGDTEEFLKNEDLFSNKGGALINSGVLIYKSVKERSFVKFVMSLGEDKERAIAGYELIKRDAKVDKLNYAKINNDSKSFLNYSPIIYEDFFCRKLNSYILKKTYLFSQKNIQNKDFKKYSVSYLWSKQISADYPIVAVYLKELKSNDDFELLNNIKKLINIYKYHSVCGYKYDLVFLLENKYSYFETTYGSIQRLIYSCKAAFLYGKDGGIHIVQVEKNDRIFFEEISRCFIDLKSFSLNSFLLDDNMFSEKPEGFIIRDVQIFDNDDNKNWIEYTNDGCKFNKRIYNPKTAFSHIIAFNQFGTLLTNKSLGFTWVFNSSQMRLSEWNNHTYDESLGEKIYISFDGKKYYDLVMCSQKFEFLLCYASYIGKIEDVFYKLEVTVHPTLFFKAVKISFYTEKRPFNIIYSFVPVAGDFSKENHGIVTHSENNAIVFKNILSNNIYNSEGFIFCDRPFVKCKEEKSAYISALDKKSKELICVETTALTQKNEFDVSFYIGAKTKKEQFEYTLDRIKEISFLQIVEEAKIKYKKFIPDIKMVQTKLNSGLNELFSFWLPYQTLICRIFARSGFYQSGGAIGFRDQLQDCLALLETTPELVKQHIIRAASHQFEEGDVQHWWHNNRCAQNEIYSYGVRSRCSDDYLWLVYVTFKYIETTMDYSILDVNVKYILGRDLKTNEDEYYDGAKQSEKHESLFLHLKKACDLFVERGFGKNGLPYMGSCDWNDGMNKVGAGGGESVWLGFFGMIVLNCFVKLCDYKKEDPSVYKKTILFLDNSCYKTYNGQWFARAYFSDNTPIGSDTTKSSECYLDILPQAFSAIAYYEIPELRTDEKKKKIILALESVYENLFDKKNNIVKLFSEPFSKTDKDPGYIKSYIGGLRENGGQYTHAAVWYAWALILFDEFAYEKDFLDRAKEIIYAINPAKYSFDVENAKKYKKEPYVMCGDVYSAKNHEGEGGWSWYTGSAGWYYQIVKKFLEKI